MPLSIRQTAASTRENMYWPSSTPRGGIVCLHGSEGGWAGWNDLYCALFAANGFAALSRNYTQNAQWLTHPDIDDVPLEGTQTALAAMRAEMTPFGCSLGLFGISRGAEHALLLAQLLNEDGCAEVPGVVTIPSLPDLIRLYCRLLSVCNKSLTSFRSATHKISLAFEYKAYKVSPATRLCCVAGRFLPKLGGIFGCRHFFAYDTYLQDKLNATIV